MKLKSRGIRAKGHTLSGGEVQRVLLAQAMFVTPALLLLDELSANLDPKNAPIVEEAVSAINRKREVTIVLLTHDLLQKVSLTYNAVVI